MTGQWKVICAATPGACTTEAMGSTMTAESRPWNVPERTLAIATNQIGQGAWTRSSISRVYPKSWDICRATDWTHWNMIEIPSTPGTSTVANADSATVPPFVPPIDCPISGNTKRKTKHNRTGCTRVRVTNSAKVFFSTTRSRSRSAPTRSSWPPTSNASGG